MESLINLYQAAAESGRSSGSLLQAITRKKLKAKKRGGRYFVTKEWVNEYASSIRPYRKTKRNKNVIAVHATASLGADIEQPTANKPYAVVFFSKDSLNGWLS